MHRNISTSGGAGVTVTADGAGVAVSIPGGGGGMTDITGKLDTDLGNVETLDATEQQDFRVSIGTDEISVANLEDPTSTITGTYTGRRARHLINHVVLTNAEAQSETSDVKGTLTGEVLSDAIDARLPTIPDAQDAEDVPVDATNFAGNLSSTDVDAQTAFDTIDGISVSLSRQDENRLEQIPRLGILTDDMRQKDVARVWEAPANSAHGMAVFTGLVTPTDSEVGSGNLRYSIDYGIRCHYSYLDNQS